MSATSAVEPSAKSAPVRGSVPSLSTTLLSLGAVVSIVVIALLSWTEVLGEDATLVASDVGGVMIAGFAAIAIIHSALSFGRGQSVGRPWLLIGASVALYAVGDAVWSYLELVAGTDPYPSAADVFYFAQYFVFLAAIVAAVLSYRRLVNMWLPLAISAAVSLVAAAAIYFTLLAPYILPAGPDELEPLAKFVSTAYPLFDVFLMLGPAVFIGVVAMRLGRGRLAWPWWIVVLGAVLYAATDSWYSLADWAGTYDAYAAIIDSGWLVANTLFMAAALVARDVYRS